MNLQIIPFELVLHILSVYMDSQAVECSGTGCALSAADSRCILPVNPWTMLDHFLLYSTADFYISVLSLLKLKYLRWLQAESHKILYNGTEI